MKSLPLPFVAAHIVGILASASAAFAGPMSFSQTAVADGAAAYWQLNDASTANGATAVSTVNPATYDGTYHSGAGTGGITSGPAPYPAMGTAAYFHNTTAQNSVSNSDTVLASDSGLPSGNSNSTLIFWEKDAVTTPQGFFQLQVAYGTSGGSLYRANDAVIYPSTNGQGFTNYGSTLNTASPAVNDGNWHFIAVTADKTSAPSGETTYTLYVDGSPVTTNTDFQGTVLSQMIIGAYSLIDGMSTVGWNGGLSNVAVFPTALSGTQISTLYANAPNAVPEPASITLLVSGLLGSAFFMARRRRAA